MSEQRGRVRTEAGQKRVRVYFGGEIVADTTRPMLVWEIPYYPAYYLPEEDVRTDLLVASSHTERSPSRGTARYFSVKAGGKEAVDAAWTYPDSPMESLRGLIRFEWSAMDAWFEEEVEVFVHPRDPFSRVDALASSRHVRVEANGVVLAETHRPVVLFETGLPMRTYFPKSDVRMDLLTPTDHESACPYKGFARYWTARAGDEALENVAWSYPTPLPESINVAGMVAFFDERVDVTIDGVARERPNTPFS